MHELFAPKKESVDSVRTWLEAEGIESERISQSTNRQWIQFDAPAAEVERLLKTEYHHYEHFASGKTNIGCDG